MKKRGLALLLCVSMFTATMFTGCGQKSTGDVAETAVTQNAETVEGETVAETETATVQTEGETVALEETEILVESPMIQANAGEINVIEDKYRTFYEVFVYSFYDSNGDGIGDLLGLTEKLDYLNDGDPETTDDLGVNGVWLMPIMPSTTYHKYDVVDYYDIDPEYGTLEDFKTLITECHDRGINVIIDFVLNHTSSKHEWFVTACDYLKNLDGKEPSESECPYFGYYNFSKKQEAGYYYQVPGTEWYYEGKFWSEMPDLNLANPAVREEFEAIVEFWTELGVDGFRLDAAKEYYSDATASNVEVLSWFNTMAKEKNEDAYIVAEVWTEVGTYAKYYESGIDSVFDFAFANNDGMITNVVKKNAAYNATSYGKAVESLVERFGQYNENYIDAPFFNNHDIGRGAGYFSGDDSEAQTKMAGALSLFMNGAAFIYYGEEIGMKGAGKDENKRAPMYWSMDETAEGMCDGPKAMENVEMKFPSLEGQITDTNSIYHYYKQAILLRNRFPEIARGAVTFVESASDENVCVLMKEYEGSQILLVFNISPKKMALNLTTVQVEGMDATSLEVAGMLVTGSEAVEKGNTSIALPSYSVAILK